MYRSNEKLWTGSITSHARERYVERIMSPKTYAHLGSCRQTRCGTCTSLVFQLRKGIQIGMKYVDPEIRKKISEAKTGNQYVTDVNFLEVVRSKYKPAKDFEFPINGDAVFVIVNQEEDSEPVLVTVMSQSMIDGMVIQAAEKDNLNIYFDRWKMQSKQTNREIKTL